MLLEMADAAIFIINDKDDVIVINESANKPVIIQNDWRFIMDEFKWGGLNNIYHIEQD